MKKINFELSQYPLLKPGTVHLEPSMVFRLEDVPFAHDSGGGWGNVLLMFTGLISTSDSTEIDYLHCIPIYFYGENQKEFTSAFRGRDVWVEIWENFPYQQAGYLFPEGYLN